MVFDISTGVISLPLIFTVTTSTMWFSVCCFTGIQNGPNEFIGNNDQNQCTINEILIIWETDNKIKKTSTFRELLTAFWSESIYNLGLFVLQLYLHLAMIILREFLQPLNLSIALGILHFFNSKKLPATNG